LKVGTHVDDSIAASVDSTMDAVVAIVEAAQKQIKTTEEILVKARPFSKGSLEIPLELVLVGASLMFPSQPLIERIVEMLKEYISIRKRLKGKPLPQAAKDGSVTIKGNVKISESVVNIIVNSQVSTVMDKAAENIERDMTIKSLTILQGDDREQIATIERKELSYFRFDPHAPLQDGSKRDRAIRTTLIIHTPVLEGRAKWKFIMDGRAISADIKDENFMERVRSGNEEFAAGDRLEVDLLVHEDYAQALSAYQSTKHSIQKVIRHSKRPTNMNLDFDG
jgi:hypothetical protein